MIGELQPELTATVTNLNRSSENLAYLTARFEAMLAESEGDVEHFVQNGLGEAPALLRESRETLRDLEKLVAELKRDPSQLIHRPPSEALDMDP